MSDQEIVEKRNKNHALWNRAMTIINFLGISGLIWVGHTMITVSKIAYTHINQWNQVALDYREHEKADSAVFADYTAYKHKDSVGNASISNRVCSLEAHQVRDEKLLAKYSK